MAHDNSKPNPKLLSLLNQIVNPAEEINLQIQVSGIYAYPNEWTTTDEQNPGLFTYQAKMLGVQLNQGKVQLRQLTDKESREQEAALAAKTKKGGAPKKGEAVEQVEDSEELKKKIQQENLVEKQWQAEYNALSAKDKVFMIQEDKFKNPSIQFEMKCEEEDDKPNAARNTIMDNDLAQFEEKVYDIKGDWIYFYKVPTLSEDEVQKLKKGKQKNLNIAELNPFVAKAWVDLGDFTVPGTSEITKRCYLQQVLEADAPADTIKYNLENTYLKVTIRLDPAIAPLVTEIKPTLAELIPNPPPIPKFPPARECISEFKNELQLSMESLALEYSQMFAKEPNSNEKSKLSLTVQKKQDIQKRKEQFVNDFNVSGKYKMLKERLKKSILKICRDKFIKLGSITGITTDQKDQFYSELYVFLTEQIRQTLTDLITYKREDLHEDIVISFEQTEKERDRILQHITKETDQDRQIRLATEYEMLNQLELAEKNYRNLINLEETNSSNYFKYTEFLLKLQNFAKAEEILSRALQYDSENKEYQLLMAGLLMRRSRPCEALGYLLKLVSTEPINQLYNTLLSFIYSKYMNDKKSSDKYKSISERIYQRQHKGMQEKQKLKQVANPFEIPSFKPKSQAEIEANKPPQLDSQEWDEIYNEMLEYFAKYNLFQLVEISMPCIKDTNSYKIQKIQVKIQLFKAQDNKEYYNRCLEMLENLKPEAEPNAKESKKRREVEEITAMKANICYLSGKLYESEDIFLKAIKLKGNRKPDLIIYLRLGNVYLKRKSWNDAKQIFVKSCELKNNSSLSWLGLGQACLRVEDFKESEEALTQANIYDPFNGDVWGYMSLLCLLDKGRFNQANQCLTELFKTDCYDLDLLEELADELFKINQHVNAEKVYLYLIKTAEDNKQTPKDEGMLSLKLGKVYNNLQQYSKAIVFFNKAISQLDGEADKNTAIELKKNATSNKNRYH